jgi:hypothetical protein
LRRNNLPICGFYSFSQNGPVSFQEPMDIPINDLLLMNEASQISSYSCPVIGQQRRFNINAAARQSGRAYAQCRTFKPMDLRRNH